VNGVDMKFIVMLLFNVVLYFSLLKFIPDDVNVLAPAFWIGGVITIKFNDLIDDLYTRRTQ
jgi:hypothetical protein